MKENKSWSFELDIETLKRWVRVCIIIFSPAIISTLSMLQDWNLTLIAIKTAFISCAIDLLRRYITDYQNK